MAEPKVFHEPATLCALTCDGVQPDVEPEELNLTSSRPTENIDDHDLAVIELRRHDRIWISRRIFMTGWDQWVVGLAWLFGGWVCYFSTFNSIIKNSRRRCEQCEK
jgi:hypothetical protein